MKVPKPRFRVVHLDNFWGGTDKSVVLIWGWEYEFYSVIGNPRTFQTKNLKRDWGKKSKWGKFIKLP